MRKRAIFGIGVLMFLLSMAFAPMGYVHAAISGGHIVENYYVVWQSSHHYYRKLVDNSIGEARAYVFHGTGGAWRDRVVFVELVRHDSNWRIDSHGYKQYIVALHGENVLQINDYGTFSPYPFEHGQGYNNYPNDIHNGIGSDMGAYVDVGNAMKYDNWHVYLGNSGSMHWIYHEYRGGEESSWHYAAIGGAFYFGGSTHKIEVNIVEWKVVSGWWIFETHKTLAHNVYAYLKTE